MLIEPSAVEKPLGGTRSFSLSSLPENSLHAIPDEFCVARIGKDNIVALGVVIDSDVPCPWREPSL